jgi:DNA-binding response OmpR family regulator
VRLLIVEDDPLIGDGLVSGLAREGYNVDWVEDGQAGIYAVQANDYDLAVIDIGLPDISGFEVLDALRKTKKPTTVLMLTARDGVQDRVMGLDGGADDYLVKPFDMAELKARLRALQRRLHGRREARITVGNVVLEPAASRVTVNGQPVAMSAKEFALILHLMENAGRVQSKRQLEETLYGWSEGVESNTLEVYIYQLRRKLGADFIHTIRGLGYIVEKA